MYNSMFFLIIMPNVGSLDQLDEIDKLVDTDELGDNFKRRLAVYSEAGWIEHPTPEHQPLTC